MKTRPLRSPVFAGGLASLALSVPAVAGAQVLAPASAPAGAPTVVASVHARNVDATLAVLRTYLPIPVNPQQFLPELVGEFGKLVALDAPVDVAVALDPQAGENLERPLWAVSFGVTNLAEVQRQAQARGLVEPAPPGLYRLRVPVGSGNKGMFCQLGPSPKGAGGPSTGRLSCSGKEKDRDALAPHLSRLSPPPAAQSADLHAELLVAPIVKNYDGPWQRLLQLGSMAVPTKLKLGQPTFDRALTDATQMLIGQLRGIGEDLHTVALDLSLQPTGAEVRLGYRLTGQKSWWGQSDAQSAARPPAPPPPMLFTLPADVSSASYRHASPAWARQVLDVVAALLDGYLEHDGLAAPDRQAIAEIFTKVPGLAAPLTTVIAEGAPDGGAKSAAPPAGAGDFSRALGMLSSGGFYLAALDPADRDQSLPWLKAVVAAYNRPAVQVYLKKKWKQADPASVLPTLKAGPALPKTLGADAYGLVLSGYFSGLFGSGGKPQKPVPTVIHVVVGRAQDGRLWTALGGDRPTLLRRLGQVVQPAVDGANTLARRPGLEALREPGQSSAGFSTLAGLSRLIDLAISATRRTSLSGPELATGGGKPAAKPAEPLSAVQLLAAIPHHGEVPMIYGARPARPNPLALTQEMYLRVPKAVIEDVIALAMNLAADRN